MSYLPICYKVYLRIEFDKYKENRKNYLDVNTILDFCKGGYPNTSRSRLKLGILQF